MEWYDEAVEREGSYQRDLVLPNLLRLMEIKKGEHVFDVACGQGFFAREFFKKGALVTGIDISSELIARAKEKSPQEIRYECASADNVPVIKNKTMDTATIILAIQNIENAKGTFLECARTLKSRGKLFIVMNHPAFRIPQESFWGWDETKKIQYRRVDRYLSESKTNIQMHPGSSPDVRTTSFHRPLQYYFKLLQKVGFVVTRLEEWESQKTSNPGPRSVAENRARKEIPLFLMIEACLTTERAHR